MTSHIIGTGSAFPKQVITNRDLSRQIGLSEEEIQRKTGISTRYWVTNGETTATLAIDAALAALQSANLPASAIDLIVVSTSSPAMFFPSVACFVQEAICCRHVAAFDINASCSGFLYALSVGDQFLKGGLVRNALIIASEVKSLYLDKNNAQTASLFGDGAGAVVLSGNNSIAGEIERRGMKITSLRIFSGGPSQQLITLPAGGSRFPLSEDSRKKNLHYMRMSGMRLFRLAVKKMDEAVSCLLKENAISLKEIDLFLFHQANARILEAVVKKRGIPPEKHHTTIQKFGNTSSSSLPLALDDAVKWGRIKRGTRLGLFTFGGGFTWGAALIDG